MTVQDHLHGLDARHQTDRLVHGRRVVQDVLDPQTDLDALAGLVARAIVLRVEPKPVCGQSPLVHAVRHRGVVVAHDHTAVARGPHSRVPRHDALAGERRPRLPHTARHHVQLRLRRAPPVHRARRHHGDVVVVPQDPCAGARGGNRGDCGQCGGEDDQRIDATTGQPSAMRGGRAGHVGLPRSFGRLLAGPKYECARDRLG